MGHRIDGGGMARMNSTSTLGILALGIAALFSGCSVTDQTVRGQSPYVLADGSPVDQAAILNQERTQAPLMGSAPGYGQHAKAHAKHHDYTLVPGARNHNYGFEGGYYAGNEGYFTGNQGQVYTNHPTYGQGLGQGRGDGCPHCQYGNACPPDGCKRCGKGCGYPHSHHTYRHVWPQNLSYPTGPVPAGMVQYPYYTHRGPTDFFMK